MFSLSRRMWTSIFVAAVCLASARAQQQQQPPPPPSTNPSQPAAPVQPITNPDNKQPGSEEGAASPLLAPTTVVTGGFSPSVGSISEQVNQFLFGFQVGELFDSNFAGLPGSTSFNEVTNFGAHFDLHRLGPSSELIIRYAGGGYLDAQDSSLDATYHQFEASEKFQFQRWSLHFDDLFSYLPDSSFGFQGIGGPGFLGVTLLDPGLAQNQTILTTQTNRFSNFFIAQAQVDVSARSTLTFTGSYGLLDFTTPGYLDSNDYEFGIGYNYVLGPRDTLGVSMAFNAYRFSPAVASIDDTYVQVAFGHHLTNRLTFHAGGGPELDSLTLPPTTGTMTTTPGAGSGNSFLVPPATSAISRTLWGASAGLDYQLNLTTTLSGYFTRGVTGGAGILTGSEADFVQFAISRRLGRDTTLSGSAGYAFNASLPQASATTTTYQSLNAAASFNHKVGQRAGFFANYTFLRQITNSTCTIQPGCASTDTVHQIQVGFNFDFRPVALH